MKAVVERMQVNGQSGGKTLGLKTNRKQKEARKKGGKAQEREAKS